MASNIGNCRSCNAPVVWVKMAKTGKKNPLDKEPVPNGNVLVSEDPNGGQDYIGETLSAEAAQAKRDEGELLYISHFATCPQNRGWRK